MVLVLYFSLFLCASTHPHILCPVRAPLAGPEDDGADDEGEHVEWGAGEFAEAQAEGMLSQLRLLESGLLWRSGSGGDGGGAVASSGESVARDTRTNDNNNERDGDGDDDDDANNEGTQLRAYQRVSSASHTLSSSTGDDDEDDVVESVDDNDDGAATHEIEVGGGAEPEDEEDDDDMMAAIQLSMGNAAATSSAPAAAAAAAVVSATLEPVAPYSPTEATVATMTPSAGDHSEEKSATIAAAATPGPVTPSLGSLETGASAISVSVAAATAAVALSPVVNAAAPFSLVAVTSTSVSAATTMIDSALVSPAIASTLTAVAAANDERMPMPRDASTAAAAASTTVGAAATTATTPTTTSAPVATDPLSRPLHPHPQLQQRQDQITHRIALLEASTSRSSSTNFNFGRSDPSNSPENSSPAAAAAAASGAEGSHNFNFGRVRPASAHTTTDNSNLARPASAHMTSSSVAARLSSFTSSGGGGGVSGGVVTASDAQPNMDAMMRGRLGGVGGGPPAPLLLAIAKQRAVVSRNHILSSALMLLGPRSVLPSMPSSSSNARGAGVADGSSSVISGSSSSSSAGPYAAQQSSSAASTSAALVAAAEGNNNSANGMPSLSRITPHTATSTAAAAAAALSGSQTSTSLAPIAVTRDGTICAPVPTSTSIARDHHRPPATSTSSAARDLVHPPAASPSALAAVTSSYHRARMSLSVDPSAYAFSPASELGVQFANEAGHGIGPTLEFFTLACSALTKASLGLWWDHDGGNTGDTGNDDDPDGGNKHDDGDDDDGVIGVDRRGVSGETTTATTGATVSDAAARGVSGETTIATTGATVSDAAARGVSGETDSVMHSNTRDDAVTSSCAATSTVASASPSPTTASLAVTPAAGGSLTTSQVGSLTTSQVGSQSASTLNSVAAAGSLAIATPTSEADSTAAAAASSPLSRATSALPLTTFTAAVPSLTSSPYASAALPRSTATATASALSTTTANIERHVHATRGLHPLPVLPMVVARTLICTSTSSGAKTAPRTLTTAATAARVTSTSALPPQVSAPPSTYVTLDVVTAPSATQLSSLRHFELLGRLVSKALRDGRGTALDLHLSTPFIRAIRTAAAAVAATTSPISGVDGSSSHAYSDDDEVNGSAGGAGWSICSSSYSSCSGSFVDAVFPSRRRRGQRQHRSGNDDSDDGSSISGGAAAASPCNVLVDGRLWGIGSAPSAHSLPIITAVMDARIQPPTAGVCTTSSSSGSSNAPATVSCDPDVGVSNYDDTKRSIRSSSCVRGALDYSCDESFSNVYSCACEACVDECIRGDDSVISSASVAAAAAGACASLFVSPSAAAAAAAWNASAMIANVSTVSHHIGRTLAFLHDLRVRRDALFASFRDALSTQRQLQRQLQTQQQHSVLEQSTQPQQMQMKEQRTQHGDVSEKSAAGTAAADEVGEALSRRIASQVEVRSLSRRISALSGEVDDLCLDFTLPGHHDMTLVALPVTLLPAAADTGEAPLQRGSLQQQQRPMPRIGNDTTTTATVNADTANAVRLLREARRTVAVPWYAAATSTSIPAAAGSALPPSSTSMPHSTSAAATPPRSTCAPCPAPPPHGRCFDVSLMNLHVYIGALHDTMCDAGLALPVGAFLRGFAAFAPGGLAVLPLFTVRELRRFFGGGSASLAREDGLWTPAAIGSALVVTHGYTPNSPQIGWLLNALSRLSPPDRRLFLKFCTGAARLPLGGWDALTPPLTVVRAVPPPGVPADVLLPTCSTCQVRGRVLWMCQV